MTVLLSDADFFGTAGPARSNGALANAVETVESGGNENAISDKGAVGPMQVMPATLAGPGFGVEPAANRSPAENRRVGKDYLQAMMRRYDGDTDKALAAYNAGPGTVDKAIARGGEDYKSLLPAQTRAYIRKVKSASAGSAPSVPDGNSNLLSDDDFFGASDATPGAQATSSAPAPSPTPSEPAAPVPSPTVERPVEAGASSAPVESSAPAPEVSAGPSAATQAAKSTPHPETGLSALAAQGATFGLSDEAGAAGAATGRFIKNVVKGKSLSEAAKDAGERYDSALAEERAGLKTYRDEHPVAATAAEIAGGAAMLPAKAGQAAVALPKAIQKLPAWAKSIGLGGLFGSLFGFGSGEGGVENRLEGAAEGAATGAATAGLVHGASRAGLAVYGKAANLVASPDKTAMRKIVDALSRDEITPAQARARLQSLGAQATVADAGGENIRGLARGAAGSPGAAKNRVTTVLQQRAETEPSRIEAAVNKGLQPEDYFGAEDTLLTKLRDNAQGAYRAAYEANPVVTTPRLERMLQSPIVRQGVRQAARDAEMMRAAGISKWLGPVDDELTALARELAPEGKVSQSGKTIPSVGRQGVAKGLSLETWQAIKEGIDRVLDSPAYTNELTGRLNGRGHAVDQLRRALVRQLDNATGGENSLYRLARQQYAGDAQTVQALRDGKNFLKLAPEQIAKDLNDLPDAGKAAYRSGAARALLDIVAKTPDQASAARRIFGNAALRSKIRAIFPDSQSYLDFARKMVAEQRFAQTKNDILAGSRTTPMAEEIKDVERPLHSAGAILGSSIPGVRHLVAAGIGGRALGSLAPKIIREEAVRNAIARRLVNRDQAMNQGLIDEVDNLMRTGQAGRSATAKRKAISTMLAILAGKEVGGATARKFQEGDARPTHSTSNSLLDQGLHQSFLATQRAAEKLRSGGRLSNEDYASLTRGAINNPVFTGMAAPSESFNPAAVSRSITKRLGAKLVDKSRSGSRYYELPDGRRLRISNHELSDDRGTSARHVDVSIDPDGEVTVKHDVINNGRLETRAVTLEPNGTETEAEHLKNSDGEPVHSWIGFAGDHAAFKKALAKAIDKADAATKKFGRKPSRISQNQSP